MRRALLGVLLLALLVPVPARAQTVLLSVDDGNYFYDLNNDCVGDTDNPQGAVALRHWHVGLPLLGPEAEVAGGFGCLGGPKSWNVTVTQSATVEGRIRYTWDTNVPGGCCNDVHLHIYDAAGNLVASTLLADGPGPVIPMLAQPRVHQISFTLGPGTYRLVEDVFSGEHSAWLTRLVVSGA